MSFTPESIQPINIPNGVLGETPAPVACIETRIYEVSVPGGVNIRSGASTSSDIVSNTEMPRGVTYEATKLDDDWYVIKDPDTGEDRYVSSSVVNARETEVDACATTDSTEQEGSAVELDHDSGPSWFEVFSEEDVASLASSESELSSPVREGIASLLNSSNELRDQLRLNPDFAGKGLSILMYAIDTLDGTGDVILNTVVVSDDGKTMYFSNQTGMGDSVVSLSATDEQIPSFIPDTDRNLIPVILDESGEIPLSLLQANQNGDIEQSIDTSALVTGEIRDVFRLSGVLVVSQDNDGDLLLDSKLEGTESIPETNLGYSVKDSTSLTSNIFDRAVGPDDLRVATRIASLPDTIKSSVEAGVNSGEIRYDFTLEAFVTSEGYVMRPDAIPLEGNGYIHGQYSPEEAMQASEMVLGTTLEVNLGESGEKVSFIFENPVIYGPLTVNPVSLEAIYDFVQRNVEAFSRYSGKTFIISLVSDVDADMLSKMAKNSNVAINMTFGNNFSHSGYSFSQQGSTENLIRIATWSSVQGERWNDSTFGFTNVMVAIASGMNVEAVDFGRRSNNMALTGNDNELLYATLTCSLAGLGSEPQSCYERPYELLSNATEGNIPIIPLVS